MAEVRTRYGALSVPDVTSDIIGRFLERYGEWAWDEAQFIASILPERAALLDVGAFLGTFGLGVSLQRPLRSLCFVEANPRMAPMLERNVRRNATMPCSIVGALVAGGDILPARPGHAGPRNLGSTSYTPEAAGNVADTLLVEAPVASVTLAQLREEHGLFDLVKLDVEGMELEILRGDADFLSRGGTAIWAECNETPASLDVADLLLSWGLDVYYFAFPSHNPDNFRGAEEAIFPFAFEAGLLAAPRSAPVLDETLRRHGCLLEPIWSREDLRRALWRTPRWGMPEWQGRPAEEVAALAGRILRGDDRDGFLAPGWKPGPMSWDRIATLERALEAAHRQVEEMTLQRERQCRHETEASATRLEAEVEIARSRREVEAMRERVKALGEEWAVERRERDRVEAGLRLAAEKGKAAAERGLAETAVLALDRLAELEVMRQERRVLSDRLAALEALLEERDALLDRSREASAEIAWLEARCLAAGQAELTRLREIDKMAGRLMSSEKEAMRLAGYEGGFHNLKAVHEARMGELEAILSSATWRLARPIHRILAVNPLLHRLFRLGGRAGGRIIRLRRRREGGRGS